MGSHTHQPKGSPSHLLRSVPGAKATLFSLCPGPREGIGQTLNFQKTMAELESRSRGSFTSLSALPRHSPLVPTFSVLGPIPGVGPAEGQSCHVKAGAKDSVSSGGVGVEGM